jgi:hypothetical protein
MGKKLQNEELHNFCLSQNIIKYQIKEDEKGTTQSIHGEDQECVQNLVITPERKGSLERPIHSWKNNIKMDIKNSV